MRTILLSLLISSFGFVSIAQVGINNTNPQAQLDIVAGATPSEKDGLLIPRLDEYPTGVGADQNGMLIFITGNGTPSKGFYYWDHTAMSWQSFVAPAGTSDADWYEAGTTNIPDAIADNLVTQGNVTIGNSLPGGVAKLNVFSNDGDNTTLRIDNTGTIGLEKSGILISNGTLDGTDTERYIGVLSSHSSTDAFQQTGFKADFSNLSNNGVYYGLNNEYPAGASNGFQRGVRNYFGGGQSAFGIENSFPGAFSYSGTTYGVYNTLQSGGNGIKYGVFNSISGLGTGTKYGTYNNISSTSGGTHYGVYSDVRKANSYSGFFIGRVSFGADGALNRYLMPTTDGTNGQVMTTNGSGVVTFQDVVGDGTNSLDEAYDEGGAGSGRIITADNGAVDIQDTGGLRVEGDIIAAQNIVHDGDADTSLQFTPDRIELDAGGTNYVNIQNDNSIIVFNEDSSAIDLRIESDNENHMFFVDGSENAIGIGRTNPVSPLQIGISTNFNLAANNIGQDGLFLIGSDNTGLNSYGASIGLGGPTTSRKNSRRAAIATVQTGPDVDNIGLSFFIHSNGINLSDMREGMRLSHQGFLGLGNTSPDATLDVVGTMQFTDGNESNGFILSSDATGNASWVDPTTVFTDTDNQVIDKLDLNGTTLELSLEDDGVADETLDLSVFANAEKIDDLLDGKSDSDGSEDGSSVFLGLNAGAADDSSDNRNTGVGYQSLQSNSTGQNNAAVGYLSLNSNTTGSENTAVGQASLQANTDGENNTGLGYHALFANTDGSNNTAVGFGTLGNNSSGGFNAALGTQVLTFNTAGSNTAMGYRASYSNTSGTRNAAFGLESLNFNSTGNDNVAVGYRAGYSTTGSGNVYLGSEAGNGTSGSNRLFIENTGADADNALIYGEFGADATTTGNILRTNSEFQIGNPTGTGYAFPTTDGSANQILTTNGNGQLSFNNPSASGVTLNQAYDFGGAGAGRTINADNGAIEINGSGTENLNITSAATETTGIYTNLTNTSASGDKTVLLGEIAPYLTSARVAYYQQSSNGISGFRSDATINDSYGRYYGNHNRIGGNTSSNDVYGVYNFSTVDVDASNEFYGIQNRILGGGTGSKYGSYNFFGNATNGALYGTFNSLGESTSTNDKYGTYTIIPSSGGGTHYGTYNDVQKATGYAAYLIGRTSLGTGTTNRYLMPEVDGTSNQILATNGAGQTSFVDPSTVFTTDNDWVTVGADIERQSGDVYIGNNAFTNNDLWVSDRIIDWDNSSYYIDPSFISRLDEIIMDSGSANNPSIYFQGSAVTGFYSPSANNVSFTAGSDEKIRFTGSGQIETFEAQSVWLGENAGEAITTGTRNVFVGRNSGTATTTGMDNTAVGSITFTNNIDGIDNTVMGVGALISSTSGNANTAIGEEALESLAAGNNNTALGFEAGTANTSGSGNVYLGYQAGRNHSGSNTLWIDNSTSTETTSLIYGEFDNSLVRVNGEIQGRTNSSGTNANLLVTETGANDGARIRFDNAVETTNSWVLYGRADDTNSDSRFNLFYSGGAGNVIVATGDGNVGIRRTPTTNDLEVNGTASKSTSGAWLANSDERLKKNIETINGNTALEKISQLRGVTYEWNDDKTGVERPVEKQYGFIAQELMEVFPEKVSKDAQGFYQTAYGDYDALFVQAIKELKAEVDALKAENEALKVNLAEKEDMQTRLEKVEAMLFNLTTNKRETITTASTKTPK